MKRVHEPRRIFYRAVKTLNAHQRNITSSFIFRIIADRLLKQCPRFQASFKSYEGVRCTGSKVTGGPVHCNSVVLKRVTVYWTLEQFRRFSNPEATRGFENYHELLEKIYQVEILTILTGIESDLKPSFANKIFAKSKRRRTQLQQPAQRGKRARHRPRVCQCAHGLPTYSKYGVCQNL